MGRDIMWGMNKPIKTVAKSLVNLLFPLHCASCKSPLDPMDDAGVCEVCKRSIRRTPKPYCRSCGRTTDSAKDLCPDCARMHPYFDKAYSACLYEGVLKELVQQFKYRNKISLGASLAGLMIDFVNENRDVCDGIDIITFVPLERSRLRERTFNQSKVLAFNLARAFGIPLTDTLVKSKSTSRQNELPREKRLVNLKGAFQVKDGPDFEGKRILLVDDVMTTGATLSECAKVLSERGAALVRCLTLARGI